MNTGLVIKNFSVTVDAISPVVDCSLQVPQGVVYAIMGPNGSGKSSLAYAIAGHPRYTVTTGSLRWQDADLLPLSADKRARLGIFLSLQNPIEIPGLTVFTCLKESYYALHGVCPLPEFQRRLYDAMDFLHMEHSYAYRGMHEGFSGGEKKRLELLQLLVLKPQLALLDEIDSGLDVDSLKLVGKVIAHLRAENPAFSCLIITHYQRLLHHVMPDRIYVMHRGSIVASGGFELAQAIEDRGYDAILP